MTHGTTPVATNVCYFTTSWGLLHLVIISSFSPAGERGERKEREGALPPTLARPWLCRSSERLESRFNHHCALM